nr:MAG TPA: hypothetical protein [Caudoviricetes sp.]
MAVLAALKKYANDKTLSIHAMRISKKQCLNISQTSFKTIV